MRPSPRPTPAPGPRGRLPLTEVKRVDVAAHRAVRVAPAVDDHARPDDHGNVAAPRRPVRARFDGLLGPAAGPEREREPDRVPPRRHAAAVDPQHALVDHRAVVLGESATEKSVHSQHDAHMCGTHAAHTCSATTLGPGVRASGADRTSTFRV